MQKQVKIGRPISGSKPKKHITRTSYNNPSLISNSVTALFKYPVAQSLQNSRGTPVPHQYADSLSRAQQQFVLRKDQYLSVAAEQRQEQRQPRVQAQQVEQSSPKTGMQRRFSSPLIQQSLAVDNKYNYLNHQSIKTKQSHGYNIINCYPMGQ